jgi:hypothetical protein
MAETGGSGVILIRKRITRGIDPATQKTISTFLQRFLMNPSDNLKKNPGEDPGGFIIP